MSAAHAVTVENPLDEASDSFAEARGSFEGLVGRLKKPETQELDHGQLEDVIRVDGMEVLRLLFQGHLDLRGVGDVGASVDGADGAERTRKLLKTRSLMSIFGLVVVTRLLYYVAQGGSRGLAPLDAGLNLPRERQSHGVRQRVAELSAVGSFDRAVAEVGATTGAKVAKRQAEELAAKAAVDFDDFYVERAHSEESCAAGELLVITVDGKGIVMRHDALRDATRKAAEKKKRTLKKRLTKGEKLNRKRMATVASVYTIDRDIRSADDVVSNLQRDKSKRRKRPKPHDKRVWASVTKSPAAVIDQAFQEGIRRDPARKKRWVAVVDGNKTQIRLLRESAVRYSVKLTIILDVIHVTEYLWKAARAFYNEKDPEGEKWVDERLLHILHGSSSDVAAGMRRSATKREIEDSKRKPVDTCADYLLKYRDFLHFDEYLSAGLPIASGVIEGACRHLIKDRMDVTGARWSLKGAEAVLKLRALWSSGDLDAYWKFHRDREQTSNHDINYAGDQPPPVPIRRPDGRPHLRLV